MSTDSARPTQRDLTLGIDCGTQSLRALLVASDGSEVASARVAHPHYSEPEPGWAEQDPEVWWRALCEATQAIFSGYPERQARLAAVAVATMRDTLVCADAKGDPLRPAILWLDTRKDPGDWRPSPITRLSHAVVGMTRAVEKSLADGKVNWIRRNDPGVWSATRHALLVSGFLQMRLTGVATDSAAGMVGHIPVDYRRGGWGGPRVLTAQLFPIEADKRYPIVAPGTPIGAVRAGASRHTSIPEGTPVIAAGSDKACEILANGVLGAGEACLSLGTMASAAIVTPRYVEPVRFMPAYPAAIANHWTPEIEIYRGYWMLEWWAREIAGNENLTVAGGLDYKTLGPTLLRTGPGAGGLLLHPSWGPGLKRPHARGVIAGFGPHHGRDAILRAIVEGLAFALREAVETLERRSGQVVGLVMATGGASRSDAVVQTLADVLGRPVARAATPETSALGAAMLAAVGAGLHADPTAAVAAMVRRPAEMRCEPRAENRALYDSLYRQWRRLWPRLDRVYRRLQEATGYPERVR